MKRRWVGAALAVLALASEATVATAQQPARSDTARVDSLRPVLLPPVVVTVTRTPTDVTHVPFAVAAIERDEIVRGRTTTGMSEALVTVPGVFVADRHNPSQDDNLSIRGFGTRSAFGVRGIKILLDGIPQTLPDGQGQLSNVELADVQRVEVLRGPSSSLYGNASGGVISLWTNRERPSRVEPTLRGTVGAYGMQKWLADVAVPLGSGMLSAEGSSLVLDGFREHSAGSTRRGGLHYSGPLSGRVRVSGHVLLADSPHLQDPGALTAAEVDTAFTAANPRNVTADAGKQVSQQQAGVAVAYAVPSGRTVNLALFGLHRSLDNPIATTYIQLSRWGYGLRASTLQPLTTGTRPVLVTMGVDAQWQRDDRLNQDVTRTTVTRNQLERVSEVGPFVQGQVEVIRRLTWTAGARYDRVAFRVDDRLLSDGDDTGARVMAAASASSGLALALHAAVQPYASVATSFDTPTTTELANRPTGPGGFNPDLQPQKAVNVEVGVRGRLAGMLAYTVNAYQAKVRDELIPFEVPGDPGRRFYRNAGSARHRGLETGVTLEWPNGVSILAAYTLSLFRFEAFRTSTDTLDGKRIPGVPTHYLHASARYSPLAGFWGAVDVTASSGMFVNDVNSVQTRAWTTVGIRAGWVGIVGRSRVSPFVGAQNLLDARYVGSIAANAQFGRYFEPAPGRNAYVGLELRPW